jgi:hypothetical protein
MTEQTETNNVISINGKDYNPNDMTSEQQYIVNQLRDLQSKADNLKFQLDQLSAAQRMFTDALIKSVESPEESPEGPLQEKVVN